MNTVSLALKLVFAVVIFELLIVGGTVIKCFDTDSCDENDSNNITLILNSKGPQWYILYSIVQSDSLINICSPPSYVSFILCSVKKILWVHWFS